MPKERGVLNQVGNHKRFSKQWDMAFVLTRHKSRGAEPKYVCFTYEERNDVKYARNGDLNVLTGSYRRFG